MTPIMDKTMTNAARRAQHSEAVMMAPESRGSKAPWEALLPSHQNQATRIHAAPALIKTANLSLHPTKWQTALTVVLSTCGLLGRETLLLLGFPSRMEYAGFHFRT